MLTLIEICVTNLPVDAILCKNMNCSCVEHKRSINAYAGSIIAACCEAADATIPLTSSRQASSCIPGWTEHVKPLRDKSIFWQNLRMDCPQAGVVAESMRRTHALYHYAICRVKKDEDNIIQERLANCILENKQRNFWTEIKRIRSKKSCMSRVIDGSTDAQSIAKLFAAKYRDLYTSVPYNNVELKGTIEGVDQQLIQSGFETGFIINVSDVKSAVQRHKARNNDEDYCLSTYHILNAPDDCLLRI